MNLATLALHDPVAHAMYDRDVAPFISAEQTPEFEYEDGTYVEGHAVLTCWLLNPARFQFKWTYDGFFEWDPEKEIWIEFKQRKLAREAS